MIIIPGELLGMTRDRTLTHDLFFLSHDDGSVFNGLFNDGNPGSSPGTLIISPAGQRPAPETIGKPTDIVRIIAQPKSFSTPENKIGNTDKVSFVLTGYVRKNDHWTELPVQAVPIGSELRSRSKGILETDVISGEPVFQAGGGSGGGPILVELAKCGVDIFHIMEHDRLEVANVWRHMAGLRDVGRYKTKFLADAIKQKNPNAIVHTYEQKVSWQNAELIRNIVKQSRLVISAIDDHAAIAILNKICVEEGKTLIIAGAFRRAYGGQVLVVRPGIGPCYECFRRCLPQAAMDNEISNSEQAERIAYSDRPVAVEPGLSNDILPISTMAVKLALVELLRDKETTLAPLREDLIAPWYLYLNRREPNTDYAQLKPMGFDLNGMRILRWYGIQLERQADCPCCGDFIGSACREHGFEISEADLAEFSQ